MPAYGRSGYWTLRMGAAGGYVNRLAARREMGRATGSATAGSNPPQGQRTSGGRDIRMASTLPPVIRPNLVPRS